MVTQRHACVWGCFFGNDTGAFQAGFSCKLQTTIPAEPGNQGSFTIGNRTNGPKIAPLLVCFAAGLGIFSRRCASHAFGSAKSLYTYFQQLNRVCRSDAKPRFSLWKQKLGNPQKPHAPLKHQVHVQTCQKARGPAKLDFALLVFPAACCAQVITRPLGGPTPACLKAKSGLQKAL